MKLEVYTTQEINYSVEHWLTKTGRSISETANHQFIQAESQYITYKWPLYVENNLNSGWKFKTFNDLQQPTPAGSLVFTWPWMSLRPPVWYFGSQCRAYSAQVGCSFRWFNTKWAGGIFVENEPQTLCWEKISQPKRQNTCLQNRRNVKLHISLSSFFNVMLWQRCS